MGVASELARNVVLSVTAGVWIGSIAWSIADARLRLPRARQVHLATALVALLPVAGLALWLIVRPGETLTQRWTRELRRLLFADMADSNRCLVCRTELEADFHCCPGCGLELQRPCDRCGAPVHASWRVCPRCGGDATPEPPAALRSAVR